MAVDFFRAAREAVSARDIAEMNNIPITRSGYALCICHDEKTPSMKFFPDGRWHCFGCGKGGDSIAFAAELYGLAPLAAVERINTDFRLGLDMKQREPTPEERREAARRRKVRDTYRLFEVWRNEAINQINAAFRLAHTSLQSLTDSASASALQQKNIPPIRWIVRDLIPAGLTLLASPPKFGKS